MLYTLVLFLSFSSTPWQEEPPRICYIVADTNGTVREICPPPPPVECVTDTCGAN